MAAPYLTAPKLRRPHTPPPRSFAGVISSLMAASLLAGCDGGRHADVQPPGGSAPQSVSFMVFGDPAELAAYRKLVDAFEAGHQDVRIQLIHIPSQGDYRRRLAADFAASTPPDVLLLNYRRFAEFAARGALEILTPYFVHSTVLGEEKFYPRTLDAFTWKGRLYGVPQNASSLVVYYNQTLFDRAGLPYPQADWTWDDFLRTAKALTRDTDGDGKTDQFGLGTEVSLARLAPFTWQNGGKLVDHSTEPTRLQLGDPPAAEAVRWFVDLQVRHRVAPGRVEERSEDSEARFQNGRTAMFLNSRRGVPTYREIQGFDWDVAPLPRRKKVASILHSDAYFIPRSSRVKEAAWQFVEFACSEPGQTLIAGTGRTVPSMSAVAESSAFLDPGQEPQNSRIFLDILPHVQAAPQHPAWVEVEEIVDDELARAFYGEASVAEVLKRATERAAAAFAEEETR